MIVSKPLTSTITSFVFFLIITIVVLGMNVWVLTKDPHPAWYNYAIIALLAPIGLFVFYKIFVRYKIIRLGNNQIEVSFPVLRDSKKYSLAQVSHWTEKQVSTGKKSVYKELEIKFEDGRKVTLGHKEFSEYPRMIQYLIQKVPKKKVNLP